MKEIVKRLLENHSVDEIPEEEVLEEMEDVEVEDPSEEEINEDWRDGKFDDKDCDRYVRKIKEDAGRIAYSLSQMKKKHPEYEKELNKALSDIRNIFSNLR